MEAVHTPCVGKRPWQRKALRVDGGREAAQEPTGCQHVRYILKRLRLHPASASMRWAPHSKEVGRKTCFCAHATSVGVASHSVGIPPITSTGAAGLKNRARHLDAAPYRLSCGRHPSSVPGVGRLRLGGLCRRQAQPRDTTGLGRDSAGLRMLVAMLPACLGRWGLRSIMRARANMGWRVLEHTRRVMGVPSVP